MEKEENKKSKQASLKTKGNFLAKIGPPDRSGTATDSESTNQYFASSCPISN
jgi:hypothetical protein